MICNIIGCNAEGYVKLMFYYFKGKSRKPMCKEIMRVCEIHARKIIAEDTNIKIQPLS
ncbi:MAG: hypothetical protein OEL81_04290 [Nitrosopumilus sp.]|nr:hypothetical protein [Nitrosopumilus sp.]